MAWDQKTAERIRQALQKAIHNREQLTEIQMMGALIFMVRGHMCCGVNGNRLMIRAGPEQAANLLSKPHVIPLEIGAGRQPRGFVCVEPKGFPTSRSLASWISIATDFVATLPDKKPRAKKGQ